LTSPLGSNSEFGMLSREVRFTPVSEHHALEWWAGFVNISRPVVPPSDVDR
jgi:hypothetical protein